MSAPTKVAPLCAPRVTSCGTRKIFSSMTSSRHTCETRRRGAVGSTIGFPDFAKLQASLVDGAGQLGHERTLLERGAIQLLLHAPQEVEELRRAQRALEADGAEVEGARLLARAVLPALRRRGRRLRGRGLLALLRLGRG